MDLSHLTTLDLTPFFIWSVDEAGYWRKYIVDCTVSCHFILAEKGTTIDILLTLYKDLLINHATYIQRGMLPLVFPSAKIMSMKRGIEPLWQHITVSTNVFTAALPL